MKDEGSRLKDASGVVVENFNLKGWGVELLSRMKMLLNMRLDVCLSVCKNGCVILMKILRIISFFDAKASLGVGLSVTDWKIAIALLPR